MGTRKSHSVWEVLQEPVRVRSSAIFSKSEKCDFEGAVLNKSVRVLTYWNPKRKLVKRITKLELVSTLKVWGAAAFEDLDMTICFFCIK